MISLIFSIPAFYVIWRVILPLPLPFGVRLCISLVILLASQFGLWSQLSSGSMFSPEFPRWLVILCNWGFGSLVLLTVFQLALDMAHLITRLTLGGGFSFNDSWRYGISIAAMLLAAVGVNQAIRVPPLKDVEIHVPGLAAAFDGYRILQLTDMHISRLFPASWTQEVVKRSNALGADLIVVTGDFIDGSISARREDVEPLRGLEAQDGVWAIPGNHEYYFNGERWMDYLSSMGMRMLVNQHTLLRRDNEQMVLAGVTDPTARAYGIEEPNLPKALAGVPASAPILLLDHQPRNARLAAAQGVAVQLSGHTHGGMIIGLDRIVAFSNGGFVSGAYQVGDMTLYVSNGTALWGGFALRLGRPAELTRITLRRPS